MKYVLLYVIWSGWIREFEISIWYVDFRKASGCKSFKKLKGRTIPGRAENVNAIEKKVLHKC